MVCEIHLLGICLVKPSLDLRNSIFGFSEFIGAFALLAIVYTVTDIRYRFRVAIAPSNLFKITFYMSIFIGVGTLLTDIWIVQQWLVPVSYISLPVWQGILGGFFLLLVLTWMYYAFIKPPTFTKHNCHNFLETLYRIVLKGADNELKVIADEIARSAKSLITHAGSRSLSPLTTKGKNSFEITRYANDTLLLMGNRKFCKEIINSCPATAIFFFEEMSLQNNFRIPITQFSVNVSTHAITNKDSILYHEDNGYRSGLIGYIKPFSQAVYGNYALVEALGRNFGSPLDIDFHNRSNLDSTHIKAYSKAVLTTFNSFLESGNWHKHSYSLYRGIDNIKHFLNLKYKTKNEDNDDILDDNYYCLSAIIEFANSMVEAIERLDIPPTTVLKVNKKGAFSDYYDHIANLMYEIILDVARTQGSVNRIWHYQHNMVWRAFFEANESKVRRIIQFKLRRLIFDSILEFEQYPNFQAARVLGYCLNVMGIKPAAKSSFMKEYYPLRKAVISWTKKNFLCLEKHYPQLADTCLMGGVSFDKKISAL